MIRVWFWKICTTVLKGHCCAKCISREMHSIFSVPALFQYSLFLGLRCSPSSFFNYDCISCYCQCLWNLLSSRSKARYFVLCWMGSEQREFWMMSPTQLDSPKPWAFAAQDLTLSASRIFFPSFPSPFYLLSNENISIIKPLHLISFCLELWPEG